jgi:hypothetical protein
MLGRLRVLFAVAAVAVVCIPTPAEDPGALPFVQKNCATCHNSALASGNVDFTALQGTRTFEENRAVWERVLSKLKAGAMPPPGVPKPSAAEIEAVTRTLEAEFARQDRAIQPDAGRVTARRLNRAEYNHTVRDLLGVDLRPADDFPQDASAYGFDNISDALRLAPALLEKYLDAAERSVRRAVFGPELIKPSMTHYPSPVRLPKLPKSLMEYDLTGLSAQSSSHAVHRFPVDAEYSFRVVLNGHRPNQSMPLRIAFWIDAKRLDQTFDVEGSDLEGQIEEWRAPVTAGEHLLSVSYLNEYHGLPAKYNGPEPADPSKLPSLTSARGKLSEQDIELLRKYGTKVKTDRIEVRVDNRTESIDVGGPFQQATGPSAESLRRIFVCGHAPGHHTAACARPIVAKFVERAFRRPVRREEIDSFLGFHTLARKQGDSFEEGIATALEAVLVSPSFLFRIEQNRPAVAGRTSVPVGDYELASRLSYFLWSTMPDDELLRLAGEHRLSQPAVLAAQVTRMLRDARSDALVENFGGQWLQFQNIDVVKPDLERFTDFDEYLRRSMRRETELFFQNIVRQDRSVLEFLDADYTFLNERLARFYGIAGVTGAEFRRVDMSKTERGGGLLAQASILTLSSYTTRTSPVLRGKWILENLLDDPPPPPPPGVPILDEAKVGQSGSLRQQMEDHRKNPACAVCHNKLDPLGFGLENFNAIGAWRSEDGKFPVDAGGVLPSGRAFHGPVELKAILLKEGREAFTREMTEKLLTYALGRGLERYDRPALAAIQASLPAHNYRFSQLVIEIVNSLPFQMRGTHEGTVTSAKAGDLSQ